MAQEEEVLGKAYDSRLMKRLLVYLRPYWWQTAIALLSILLKVVLGPDVIGPFLTATVIDRYLTFAHGTNHSILSRWLNPNPLIGIGQIALIYFTSLLFNFVLEFVQTYLMQWTGQKIMFDLRSQIFRHLQRMHVGFYDRNPVGRLVTRITSDVDALNEMFTSGVLAIFEDVFSLTAIIVIMLDLSWPLALLTLSVVPLIVYATKRFRDHVRDSYRRQRAATAKINSFTQEYVSGMEIGRASCRER